MERTINSFVGCRMVATNGDVGAVDELYFDDETWTIRYLIVKMEEGPASLKVLIATGALIEDRAAQGVFFVNHTKEQIVNSPGIDTDKPVSRQQEIELYGHYAWKGYWESGFYAGGSGPGVVTVPETGRRVGADLHLRSTAYVTGFHIHGTDGEIGYISNFVIDDRSWKVLSLVVNTSHLPDAKMVRVPVSYIIQMQWNDSEVYLNETKADIEKSAVFEPAVDSQQIGGATTTSR